MKSIRLLQRTQFPELKALLSQLAQIISSMNPVEIYTADNATEQKTIFLREFTENSNTNFCPQFTYNTTLLKSIMAKEAEIVPILEQIAALSATTDEQDFLKTLALRRAQSALDLTHLARHILVEEDFNSATQLINIYGPITDYSLDCANRSLEQKRNPPTPSQPSILDKRIRQSLSQSILGAEQIQHFFRQALRNYDFADLWEVKICDKATAIDVRDKSANGKPTIVIPKGRTVTEIKLLELIGHEIDSHVRQSMNGIKLYHGLGGGVFKSDDEVLYEGLAKISDIDFAVKYLGKPLELPAPYFILAMDCALKGETFATVFKQIFELIKDTKKSDESAQTSAWSTTYRVFRGSTDPHNEYGYYMPKDRAYLEGYLAAMDMKNSAHYSALESGIFTLRDMELILSQYRIRPNDIPFPTANNIALLAESFF